MRWVEIEVKEVGGNKTEAAEEKEERKQWIKDTDKVRI